VKDLVPIGRFSNICRLSLKALRLYDELGLLRPALVDPESGYRYYSLSQALEAERIRLLRSIEVPLDEIGQYLRASGPGAARELLERHRARLEARVAQYRAMLADVEKLAKQETSSYEVRTREIAAQQVLSIRTRARLVNLGDEGARAFGEMIAHLGRAQAEPAGPVFALYHGPEFDEEAVDVEWCVPVDRPVSGQGHMSGRELPGGTVAWTLHAGPYDAVGPSAYAALQSWMQEHGHESDGPPREVYLVGPCQAREPAAYRTELQWPIR
jgi:effector-binding domain-containing protein